MLQGLDGLGHQLFDLFPGLRCKWNWIGFEFGIFEPSEAADDGEWIGGGIFDGKEAEHFVERVMMKKFGEVIEILFRSPIGDGIELHRSKVRDGDELVSINDIDGCDLLVCVADEIDFHPVRDKAQGVFRDGEDGGFIELQCLEQGGGVEFDKGEVVEIYRESMADA